MQHPGVAYRDCGHCQRFAYDEKTGKPELWRGEPIKRSAPPPCRYEIEGGRTKCPKGTPEKSRMLTEQNEEAYEHYLQCQATGQFPDDPIVRRNAALIRRAVDAFDEIRENDRYVQLATLITAGR